MMKIPLFSINAGLRGVVLSKCFLLYRENTVYLISVCLQIIRLSDFLLCTRSMESHPRVQIAFEKLNALIS